MFIKNKIMVSLKKYIIKWLKILQTPIVKEYQYEVPFMIWCSDNNSSLIIQ